MPSLTLPSAVDLARTQFALTVVWHFLFPAFTIGLASFLAVLEGRWLATGKAALVDEAVNYVGDQVAGSHHLSQNFLFRPALGHATGKTPVDRLHLTGASVWPGAGTGAGSGYMLAQKLGGK